jgi:HD superfamily phosphohydrolase
MTRTFSDALYGEVALDPAIIDLCKTPVLQRLRDVRLSNIDSLDMPGISSITRFEHSLGVAHVASCVGFAHTLPKLDFLVLRAAALLHDAAIAPFGHLLEEAFSFAGIAFDHETKWQTVAQTGGEVGGLNNQIYLGRESGLTRWAKGVFGTNADGKLNDILKSIKGEPPFGAVIAAADGLDVDNLDNVVRIAYHMGLPVDTHLPLKLAAQTIAYDSSRVSLTSEGLELARRWLKLRSEVYNRLMPAGDDFVGKIMLLYSFVTALEVGILTSHDWALTDRQVIQRLQESGHSEIQDTVNRWLLGELWSCSRLMWLRGTPPSFAEVRSFSAALSDKRTVFFGYRIKDKRYRRVSVLSSGTEAILGQSSSLWLLGLATSKREPITAARNHEIAEHAASHFHSELVSFAPNASETPTETFFPQPTRAAFN